MPILQTFDNQYSPAHIVAGSGSISLWERIAERLADSNPKKKDGISAYHLAAQEGNLEICRSIINNAVENKCPKDITGKTPLHKAVSKGHYEVCQLILENIEIKNPVDNNGLTPLDVAASFGYLEIYQLIEDMAEIKRVLESLGVKVYQPEPLKREGLTNKDQIPHVPLQPRDIFLTLGNTCYQQNTNGVYDYMKDFVHEDCLIDLFNEVYGPGGASFEGHELISGANSIKLGKHIIMPADGEEGFVHPDRPMFNHIIDKWKQQGYEIIQTDENLFPPEIVEIIFMINFVSLYS